MLLFKIAVINKNVYDIFTDTNILIKLTKFLSGSPPFKTFSIAGTNYSFAELSNNVTFGTRTSLDGQDNTLLFVSTELGRFIKTKLTMPAEITITTTP